VGQYISYLYISIRLMIQSSEILHNTVTVFGITYEISLAK
jgi:hypothetical protein